MLNEFIDCIRNDCKIIPEIYGGHILSFPTISSQEDCPDQSDFSSDSLYKDMIADLQYMPGIQNLSFTYEGRFNYLQIPVPLPTKQSLQPIQKSNFIERTKDRIELAIIEEENTLK
jgi:hypothetical protein